MEKNVQKDLTYHGDDGDPLPEVEPLTGSILGKMPDVELPVPNGVQDWEIVFENEFGHYFENKPLLVERAVDFIKALLQEERREVLREVNGIFDETMEPDVLYHSIFRRYCKYKGISLESEE